jgi:hypothetical protein
MQFLMTDGTLRTLDDVVWAEVEDGQLVCRDRHGAVIVSFGRHEAVAFGKRLGPIDSQLEERRSGWRREV